MIILGVIFIASILIVPIFLAIGYLFRILKATFAGIDELPDFDELGSMFVDGIKVFIVGLVYAIPLIIISYVISAIFNIGQYSALTASTFTGFNIYGLATAYIIYFIIAIIIGLIEYMAIANMALYDGDLGAAFKFNEIIERIKNIGWGKYILWYIVMILLAIVTGFIASLTFIILIGIVIVPLIIAPYFAIFATRSLALLFASSEDKVMETPAQEEPAEKPTE